MIVPDPIPPDGGSGVCGASGSPATTPVSGLPTGTHDETSYGASSPTPRGNITSITRKCFGCTDVTTQYAYDETGEVTTVKDAKNNITHISHADSPPNSLGSGVNSNAYVTQIDPRGSSDAQINGVSHASNFSYDYSTGNVLTVMDPNNKTTSYSYDPALKRLSQISYPDGGETGYCYNDVGGSYPGGTCSIGSPFQVYAGTKKDSSSNITSYTKYDGLGRATETALTSAPGSTIYTDTTYDGLDRVMSVTNPYQGSPSGSVSYLYDALGRKILQTQQDGSALGWCYDGIPNSSISNCPNSSSVTNASWVTSQDEAGHLSQHVSDGLGRLVAVMEQQPSGTALALETDYTYNALDDLLSVNQKGATGETARNRSFSYNSLSQLVQAYNPEAGWICYGTTPSNAPANGSNCSSGYDADGNLQFKTDARGITVNYFYDALNRLTSKTYANAPSGSLPSCYAYDTAPNGKGRLAFEWTTAGSCSTTAGYQTMRVITAYDPMGRVWNEQQCVLGNCTTGTVTPPCQTEVTGIAYCYDYAGNQSFATNGLSAPSLAFTNTYDSAGRLSSLTSSWNDLTHPSNLFTANGYAASGQILSFSLGNHIGVTKAYDNRLRPTAESAVGQ